MCVLVGACMCMCVDSFTVCVGTQGQCMSVFMGAYMGDSGTMCVCVYGCMCVCATPAQCVCAYGCMCVCVFLHSVSVWRPEVNLGCYSSGAVHLALLETGSHLVLGLPDRAKLAEQKAQESSSLHISSTGTVRVCHHA